MRVNLHIVYKVSTTSNPVPLTDEKYETFKALFGVCEKQNALYSESGHFAGLVHHTDIEVDTESEYQRGYSHGYSDGTGDEDADDWQAWTPVFPQD